MPLYDYSLFIVREAARGDLLADARAAGVIGDPGAASGHPVEKGEDTVDGEGACMGGRVACALRRTRHRAEPRVPLEILELCLDTRAFERALAGGEAVLSSWLWGIADSLAPACMLMPGGSDMTYREGAESAHAATWRRMPELVGDGVVAAVHPVMYFAERLGGGTVCARARTAPWTLVEHRAGLGTLLLLVERDLATGAIDVREPAHLYETLRAHFAS